MGAGDLARGIAARRFSSTEVVSAFIDRQNEVQPRLNAVAVALHDQAAAAAKAADRSRPEDGQKLYGVPVTVKECFDVVGTATTAGLVGRAADLKSDDAELVSVPGGQHGFPQAKQDEIYEHDIWPFLKKHGILR